MRRATLLALTLIALTASFAYARSDWKDWSEGKAKKVIRNASKLESISFGQTFGRLFGGALAGGAKIPQVQVTWLTDEVCWAVARIRQIQERLSDGDAVQVHDQCRSEFAPYFAIYISSSEIVLTPYFSAYKEDVADTSNPNRIFLQHKNNREVFIRPVKVIRGPLNIVDSKYLNQLPSLDGDAIILFPRDPQFLMNQKEVEFEMVQEGDKIRTTFKIKDLVEEVEQL